MKDTELKLIKFDTSSQTKTTKVFKRTGIKKQELIEKADILVIRKGFRFYKKYK